MRRYARQTDDYSCGPTAIINALKWSGFDMTLQLLPFFQHSCRTIDPVYFDDWDKNGTFDSDFDRVLRWSSRGKIKVRKKNCPLIEEIKEHLKDGGALCLSYYWRVKKENIGHFIFIEKLEDGYFFIINDHDNNKETVKRRREKTIKKWLSNRYSGGSIAWFLTKTDS